MATSYKDPLHDDLDAKYAAQVGVPDWLMKSIRTNGERSNSDQVSSADARTVNQFTPTTRNLVIKKYGVDPWASDDASALGKAYLLKESLDRNGQDPAAAAREYIGGTNPANYGPQTKAYVNRVMMARPKTGTPLPAQEPAEQTQQAPSGQSTFDRVSARMNKPTAPAIASIFNAYQSGQMDPQDAAQFEGDVNAGRIMLPNGAKLKESAVPQATQPAGRANAVPDAVVQAYQSGKMSPADAAQFESDMQSGIIQMPGGAQFTPLEKPGLGARLADVVTGDLRATEETNTLPEWTGMPELNQLSMASMKAGAGTIFAPSTEVPQIIQAQFPGVKVRQDDRGNNILTSSVDGKEYAIPPGLKMGDIPRVIGAVAAFTPAGRAVTLPGMAAGGAATQAVIEGTQAATGGDFNTADVALAGVAAPVASLVAKGVGGTVRSIANVLQKGGAPVEQQAARVAQVAPEAAPLRAAPEVPSQPVPTVEVAEKVVSPVSVKPNDTGTYLMAESPSGKVGGTIKGDGLHINYADVAESMRGQGEGLKLYQALIDDAHSKGLKVFSDSTVEKDAVNVYRALKKRGYDIGDNVAGVLDEEGGAVYGKGANSPAFEVRPKPTQNTATTTAQAAAPEVPPVAAVAEEAAPAIAEMSQEQLASVAKKAATGSLGKKSATEELAAQAAPDKAVTEAAERLKMELDPDFVTSNEQFRRLVGLTRSQAGSAAEARGIKVAADAADKAEEAMQAIGASRDIASVSDKIKSSLSATRDEMERASNALYNEVDEIVPKSYPVEMPATKARIESVISDMGGIEGLSSQEKKLADLFEGPVTYARLARERGLIGKALAGKESPYGSMEEGALKQLYKAMASDQLDAVTSVGGEALRDKYRLATQLVAQRKGLEKRIVGAFGKDGAGSLVPALRNSISASVRGDDKGLSKLIQTIPEPLRKEALSSALLNYAASTTKGGQFGFPQYAKMYQGMRQNSPVYASIVKTLGEGSDALLTDLYQVSQSIAKAQQAVLHTGKANQGFLDTLKGPETLVGKVLEGAKGAAARGIATEAATSMAIGPTGAGFMGGAVQAIAGGRKDALKAVGDLLTSPEFKEVVRQAGTKDFVSNKSIERLARSRAMRGYGDILGGTFKRYPTEREAWINAALQSARGKDREPNIAGQGNKL